MNDHSPFNPLQAQEVAKAFAAARVDYLFIGEGGAILLGFPGTTQAVGVFPAKDPAKGRRIVAAVCRLGFRIDDVGLTAECSHRGDRAPPSTDRSSVTPTSG